MAQGSPHPVRDEKLWPHKAAPLKMEGFVHLQPYGAVPVKPGMGQQGQRSVRAAAKAFQALGVFPDVQDLLPVAASCFRVGERPVNPVPVLRLATYRFHEGKLLLDDNGLGALERIVPCHLKRGGGHSKVQRLGDNRRDHDRDRRLVRNLNRCPWDHAVLYSELHKLTVLQLSAQQLPYECVGGNLDLDHWHGAHRVWFHLVHARYSLLCASKNAARKENVRCHHQE